MSLWAWWIVGTVTCVALKEAWDRHQTRERKRAAEWVREFSTQFPGRCPVCSFTRRGREMGISAAYNPVEPHPCPEAKEDDG